MSPVAVKICELCTFPYTTTDTPGAAFTLGAGGVGDRVVSVFISAVFCPSALDTGVGVLFLGVMLLK